jgi:catechol 2,3-dioxygenase-like lactoylglutathione lyase family enzyme
VDIEREAAIGYVAATLSPGRPAVIDHLSLPVSDYARSRAFYDKALGALGYKVAMEVTDSPEYVGAGYGDPGAPEPAFWIGASREPGPPPVTPEGQHVAFRAASRAAVDAFHCEALAAGGADNGAPGLRPHYHANYYAAFVLDPDGHRLEAVCHRPG